MKYLVWRAQVKQYIQDTFDNSETWEQWATWRELYLNNLSAVEAAKQAHKAYF